MGITYKIDVENGVIFTVAEGEIGAADIQANTTRFTADPLYTPNLPQLFDGRSAQFSFSSANSPLLVFALLGLIPVPPLFIMGIVLMIIWALYNKAS